MNLRKLNLCKSLPVWHCGELRVTLSVWGFLVGFLQTLWGKWAAAAADKSRGIMHVVDKVSFSLFVQWRSCEA